MGFCEHYFKILPTTPVDIPHKENLFINIKTGVSPLLRSTLDVKNYFINVDIVDIVFGEKNMSKVVKK